MLRITTRGVMAISFAAFVLAGCASKTEVEEPVAEVAPVVVAPVVEAPVVAEVKRPMVSGWQDFRACCWWYGWNGTAARAFLL